MLSLTISELRPRCLYNYIKAFANTFQSSKLMLMVPGLTIAFNNCMADDQQQQPTMVNNDKHVLERQTNVLMIL
ncbi:hypothetical protein BLOT_012665 [Blomia tropicalis]|nr:hypothetical protein BLOT_012665 [Blomia tropicalis]